MSFCILDLCNTLYVRTLRLCNKLYVRTLRFYTYFWSLSIFSSFMFDLRSTHRKCKEMSTLVSFKLPSTLRTPPSPYMRSQRVFNLEIKDLRAAAFLTTKCGRHSYGPAPLPPVRHYKPRRRTIAQNYSIQIEILKKTLLTYHPLLLDLILVTHVHICLGFVTRHTCLHMPTLPQKTSLRHFWHITPCCWLCYSVHMSLYA